jgi:hypothetical protein
MSGDPPPSAAAAALLRGLREARDAGVLKDEDYAGLPLPEPLSPAEPGLAIALFPTGGRIPGGPNLVYPARLIIRVALSSTQIRFDPLTEPLRVPVEGPGGSLGSLDDLANLAIADRQKYRAQYVSALDPVAAALAGGPATDRGYRDAVRMAFERLREKALAASYAVIGPLFNAWLYG